MRGFIKELCSLMLLFLSFFLTIDYYDFFTINYSKYFGSEIIINLLSIISVFILLNLVLMTLNNWVMYLLLPIRLGLTDRFTAVIIGTIRGVLVSYLLFSVIYLYCYVVYPESEKKISDKKEVLPDVVSSSYSYQMLFSKIDDSIDSYISDSLILKIKDIGQKIIKPKDQEIIKLGSVDIK